MGGVRTAPSAPEEPEEQTAVQLAEAQEFPIPVEVAAVVAAITGVVAERLETPPIEAGVAGEEHPTTPLDPTSSAFEQTAWVPPTPTMKITQMIRALEEMGQVPRGQVGHQEVLVDWY